MSTIFTKIINRELQGYIIAEEAEFIAFLDIHPLTLGHTLVVPKKEVDYLFDLDDTTLSGLMRFAKKVAIGLEKIVPCLRVGMAVIGLEVPHAHVHLVPLNDMYDIDFKKPKLQLSQEELIKLTAQLQAAIPS
jgi:histidine triad (HIT) family protein